MEQEKQTSVAIIGAGISGIMAAVQLQKKGYDVQILERLERVGGKCYSVEVQSEGQLFAVEMGASVLAISYQNILQHARLFHAPLFKPTPYKVIEANGQISSLHLATWSKTPFVRLVPQVWKYIQHVTYFQRHFMDRSGYKDHIPALYRLSFTQFCEQEGMKDLIDWFDLPIAAWGYQTQDKIPTWYVFGEIDLLGFLGVLITTYKGRSSFVKSFSNGYSYLLKQLIRHYQLPVQTNTEVQKITRNSYGVAIETQKETRIFDYVILSTPSLAHLVSNPSEQELHFLEELRYAPYATALCTLQTALEGKFLVKQNLHKRPGLRMISAPYEQSKLAICYYCMEKDSTAKDLEESIQAELKSLNIPLREIHKIQIWNQRGKCI